MVGSLKVKNIRALERGLLILETILQRGSASLAEMHERTSLSRATILRALRTLEENGWITSGAQSHRYQAGPKVARLSAAQKQPGIDEIAGPVLDDLSDRLGAPADLAVREGSHMLIVKSSRKRARFTINRHAEGRRPCMLKSALGRAYFGFCPEAERRKLLGELRLSEDPDDRPSRVDRWVDRLVSEVRRSGYGVREPGYYADIDDEGVEVSAIAVPILNGPQVIACISLMWVAGSEPVASFASRSLPVLRESTELLLARLQSPSAQPPRKPR